MSGLDSGSEAKVEALRPFFERMPDAHLAVVFPIFIMRRKPGGALGGGTWPRHAIRSDVMGPAHSDNSGVPDDEIKRWIELRGRGLIGLSRDRWERPAGSREFSVLHEVGHCIDVQLGGLVPAGATGADFAGMETDRCGAGGALTVRQAVEVYARWMCSPSRVYHFVPPGDSSAAANDRLKRLLRRSAAFRSVPTTWPP